MPCKTILFLFCVGVYSLDFICVCECVCVGIHVCTYSQLHMINTALELLYLYLSTMTSTWVVALLDIGNYHKQASYSGHGGEEIMPVSLQSHSTG